MAVISVYSDLQSPADAASDAAAKAGSFSKKAVFVLFFASSGYNPSEIASAVSQAFPGVASAGCTTAGEITSGKMLKKSLVVMLFDSATVKKVKIAEINNINSGVDGVAEAFNTFSSITGTPMASADHTKYTGMVLVDGLSGIEEKLMEKIGALTDVSFIGGSAGDDLQFKQTHVFSNGRALTNAAVLVLLEPVKGFKIVKTQSFSVKQTVLEATDVIESSREVISFNGKPARIAYAEALGVPPGEADKKFMSNPLGLLVRGEPYVRSPQQFCGDNLRFYCQIKKGMKLNVLQSDDIVDGTKKALDTAAQKKYSALINFHCILRTLELESKKQTDAYGQLFNQIPSIGFSTYGEQLVGHINQTSTMLLLG